MIVPRMQTTFAIGRSPHAGHAPRAPSRPPDPVSTPCPSDDVDVREREAERARIRAVIVESDRLAAAARDRYRHAWKDA
jgi:hypothetical protein